MTTFIVCWGEGSYKPTPLGTVPSVDIGKQWCKEQADQLIGGELHAMFWRQYLSRGDGPKTAHWRSVVPGGTFEIWGIGDLMPAGDLDKSQQCAFPGCAAFFDSHLVDDNPDSWGGFGTGWYWISIDEDAKDCAPHDHRLP